MRDNWVLGGVLGGAARFFWGMVSHLLLPVGELGVRAIPPEHEAGVVAALGAALPERALYLFPGLDPAAAATDAGRQAWLAEVASGPTGLVAFNPGPGVALGPEPLAIELLSGMTACLLAAWLLTRLAPGTPYLRRVGAVVALGVFAALAIEVSYWNWYRFPTIYLLGQALDQVVGMGLAGLVIARHARPAAG